MIYLLQTTQGRIREHCHRVVSEETGPEDYLRNAGSHCSKSKPLDSHPPLTSLDAVHVEQSCLLALEASPQDSPTARHLNSFLEPVDISSGHLQHGTRHSISLLPRPTEKIPFPFTLEVGLHTTCFPAPAGQLLVATPPPTSQGFMAKVSLLEFLGSRVHSTHTVRPAVLGTD